MDKRKQRVPKKGDRVKADGQNGAFVVYSIDAVLQTVEMRSVGGSLRLSAIPWSALTFLDKEDASQATARSNREATDNH